jgi:penicillin-binding protein 2
MQNKRGGIVAIEPATGEIFWESYISTIYDPSDTMGRDRSKNINVNTRH